MRVSNADVAVGPRAVGPTEVLHPHVEIGLTLVLSVCKFERPTPGLVHVAEILPPSMRCDRGLPTRTA